MGFVLQKIRNQSLKLYKLIENNDNPDPARNGEQALVGWLLRDRPVDTTFVVFDCGAHRGEWTGTCLREIGKRACSFHLFEPSPSSCGVLRERFSWDARVTVNCAGVSDAEGERTLFEDKDGSSLASLYPRRISDKVVLDRRETISLRRLDGYLSEQRIDHIDLLKLDVEGHELSALRGLGAFLTPRRIGAIQFEYGGANIDSGTRLADFYAFLRPLGFVVCKIMRDHLEPRDYSPSMENFMYSNYVALPEPR